MSQDHMLLRQKVFPSLLLHSSHPQTDIKDKNTHRDQSDSIEIQRSKHGGFALVLRMESGLNSQFSIYKDAYRTETQCWTVPKCLPRTVTTVRPVVGALGTTTEASIGLKMQNQ